MSFLFVLISVITVVKSDNHMMVVFGKPTKFHPVPYLNETLDWKDCVETCYTSDSCVLAFQNETGCNLFWYSGMPPIQKTNSSEGSIVAFKISSTQNSTDYMCPNGENAPTFNNKNATGYLYIDDNPLYLPIKVWYNISLTNSIWRLSYSSIPMCWSNYYGYYVNPSGTWCATFLSSNLTSENIGVYSDVNACESFGAILPSINYPVDIGAFTWFLDISKNQYAPNKKYYIRIDGIRTKTCQSTPKSASCMTASGFTFTDSRFKGSLDYYNWATNAGARAGTDDDCIVLVYPPTVSGENAKTDIRSCTTIGAIQPLGSLCLRQAFT